MAENTGISWAQNTYNHWYGCAKVSPACRNCYAEDFVTKRLKLPVWGHHSPRHLSSAANRKKPYAWNRKAMAEGRKIKVFCSSLSDVFEDREELNPWRKDLFKMIEETQGGLIWLLLTKRADRMAELAKEAGWGGEWPENVWAGVTVENQSTAEDRIPHLLTLPLHENGKRFLSMEPLLGPVDLTVLRCPSFLDRTGPSYFNALDGITFEGDGEYNGSLAHSLDWVIVGGESGSGARSMNVGWALDIQGQIESTRRKKVAFFFKQLGDRPVEGWDPFDDSVKESPIPISSPKGKNPSEWPERLRLQEFPEF